MVLGRNSRCDEDGGQNRETEETSRKLFVCFKSFFLRGTESETVKGPGSSGGKKPPFVHISRDEVFNMWKAELWRATGQLDRRGNIRSGLHLGKVTFRSNVDVPL